MRGDGDEPGLELSELWRRVWSGRVSIFAGAIIAGAIATLISFLLPSEYEATTQVMPSPQGSGLGALSTISASLADLGVNAEAGGTNPEIFAPIIYSRQVLTSLLSSPVKPSESKGGKSLIDFLDPPGSGAKRLARGLAVIRRSIGVDLDRRSGVVTVTVRSRDPEVAAQVANSVDSLVQGFLLRSASSQAAARREFIEGRLAETRTLLSQREDDLRQFRQKNIRIGNSPSLELEEARLQRALREQEELYMTLVREFETAKIDALKDVPTLTVVDPATPPVFRAWPKRKLIALFGVAVGLVGSCTLVVGRPSIIARRDA